MSDEYNLVELPALMKLQDLGWSYVEGVKLSPEESDERDSLKDVVLEKRLSASIKRINPWISDENLRKVVRDLTKAQYTNLVEANQAIWTQVNQSVSVMQDVGKGNRGQTVHIIDFENIENNEFLCTNQFKVSGVNQNIKPDIICFVNGLPLAVIECKSPFITNPMEAGIDQLLRYANRRTPEHDEGAEKLFHYNSLMVSTYRDKARFGSITSRMEHYLEWKDPYPLTVEEVGAEEASQDVLLSGMFTKANFLDILQNFTVFEPVDGRIIKKMARYQQFRAVHKAIKRIKSGETQEDKSGVIWHTQGSGKSLTMVFLSIKMRRDSELRDYKLVFLTDRIQLDRQLTSTFKNTQDETIYNATSAQNLKELLTKDSSDIVTALVQKFWESLRELKFSVLNESEKIIVLVDEAHRSQYGPLGATMFSALPNAPRIAFTGTPLIKEHKTARTFGSYIDTYTIEQSVLDGATVQILYEGREPVLRLTGDSLDSLFDEYFADRSDKEKAEIKRRFGTEKAILEAPQRIRRICLDIIKHYREHIQPNGFKAMIVTSSRHAAITYKEQLDDLKDLGSPQSAVIISGDHNDEKRYWEYTKASKHKQQIDDFKKPLGVADGQSDLSFLIVKDMLLTGFDAPIAQVMYLDRKLTDHSLLQAIARVNRTNQNKFSGYIIDYYGLSDYLAEALEMFSTTDIQGALIELKEELPKLKNAHTRVIQHFKGKDLDNTDACIVALKDEIKRQTFQTDFRIFGKQLDIILPDPAATPYLNDLKRLGKIAIGARNLYRDEQLDITGAGEKVRKIIADHLTSANINPKIAPVGLLASNFEHEINKHKSDRSKASDIEHAIRHHIKVNADEDPEYYKTLSERLEEIIRETEEKWDVLVQLLIDLRSNIEVEHRKLASELGLTEMELPFYSIFIAELGGEDKVNEQKKQQAKEAVRSLVQIFYDATRIVDFDRKKDEQGRVEREIKHLLMNDFDKTFVNKVSPRFMDLIRVKFKQ